VSETTTEASSTEQSATEQPATEPQEPVADSLENEGEIAADYLEELLEIADLDGDIDMDVEGDRATVSIVGAELPQLVGKDGEVLDALQELTRLAVYRETGERSRLMLDVSGHRADRRSELEAEAVGVIQRAKDSGEKQSMTPMTPFERKVVHDAVAAAGLTSESEGVEPRRFVVVLPATDARPEQRDAGAPDDSGSDSVVGEDEASSE
jgi:spoIIIJ-associated protein